MDNKQNGLNEAYKFYVCSTGDPKEDYHEDNFARCIKYKAHFQHEDALAKGPFDEIKQPAIVILKHDGVFVAYGEVIEAWVDDINKELENWTYRVDVKEWIWKDPNDHHRGVSIVGIRDHTIGNKYSHATIKQIVAEWGLGKINEIDGNSDLAKKLNSLNKINREMEQYKELLESNKNLILTGAPGTGKTYLAKQIAKQMIGTDDIENNEQYGFVQFHPSYDYTDFVEGLRPTKPDANRNIGFELKEGVFKEFCGKARADKDKKYVFVIDEINRGDISKIFGELFFSIDTGYRGKKGAVKTQYDNMHKGEKFYVPENVYIIGTMNDIDRSVESFDFAMRRRFIWQEVTAKESAKNMQLSKDTEDRMDRLNDKIEKTDGLNSSYQIGGAYFLDSDGKERNDYDDIWELRLKPLLSEYLRGMPGAKGTLENLKKAYDGISGTTPNVGQ